MRKILVALFALFTAFAPSGARAVTATVDTYNGVVYAADEYTDTGIHVEAGQFATLEAWGAVNLAIDNGNYVTDPDGVILSAPKAGSEAYDWFGPGATKFSKIPLGAGGLSINEDGYFEYGAANYGSLIGILSEIAPNDPEFDPGTAFAFVLGSYLEGEAPIAGNLYLFVNDINRDDNDGSFVVLASVSQVPLPAALPLFGTGLVALAFGKRRKAA